MAESIFGKTITNSDGKRVPTRLLGEQHVKDDLGRVPTVADWLTNLRVQPWMTRTPFRPTTRPGGEPTGSTPEPTPEPTPARETAAA